MNPNFNLSVAIDFFHPSVNETLVPVVSLLVLLMYFLYRVSFGRASGSSFFGFLVKHYRIKWLDKRNCEGGSCFFTRCVKPPKRAFSSFLREAIYKETMSKKAPVDFSCF